MASQLSVLFITTQPWLQVTRLAMRFAGYGARIAAIGPEQSHLMHAPCVTKRFLFSLARPLHSLRRAIAASGAEYLLPTDDLSAWLLHELAAATPALRPLILRSLGSHEAHPVLRSRLSLLRLAERLGIAVPRTEPVRDAEALRRWSTREAGGFVLKKDGTWGGRGVEMVAGQQEALAAGARLERKESVGARLAQWLRIGDGSVFARLSCFPPAEITAQALVAGVPANSMYACHEGAILGEVQARVAVSRGRTGPSLAIELMRDPRITRAGEALASALGLSGFFGLDFMLDGQSGQPYLIELNPRSTQLGHVAVAGQADLAAQLWARWTGSGAPDAAGPELASSVCFYPDGARWAEQAAGPPAMRTRMRPDVQPGEREAVDALLARASAPGGSLRRRAWSTFARTKAAFGGAEEAWQPFHHRADWIAQPEADMRVGVEGPARQAEDGSTPARPVRRPVEHRPANAAAAIR